MRTGGPRKQFVSAEKRRLAKEKKIKEINNTGSICIQCFVSFQRNTHFGL